MQVTRNILKIRERLGRSMPSFLPPKFAIAPSRPIGLCHPFYLPSLLSSPSLSLIFKIFYADLSMPFVCPFRLLFESQLPQSLNNPHLRWYWGSIKSINQKQRGTHNRAEGCCKSPKFKSHTLSWWLRLHPTHHGCPYEAEPWWYINPYDLWFLSLLLIYYDASLLIWLSSICS